MPDKKHSRNARTKKQVYVCALSRDAQKPFWHKGCLAKRQKDFAKKHRPRETGAAGHRAVFTTVTALIFFTAVGE